MITVERVKDQDLIKKLYTNPSIYPAMITDSSTVPCYFKPNMDHVWLLIKHKKKIIGIMQGVEIESNVWEGHVGLLRKYQGKGYGQQAIDLGAKYLKEHKKVDKIVSRLPYSRMAVHKILHNLNWNLKECYSDPEHTFGGIPIYRALWERP